MIQGRGPAGGHRPLFEPLTSNWEADDLEMVEPGVRWEEQYQEEEGFVWKRLSELPSACDACGLHETEQENQLSPVPGPKQRPLVFPPSLPPSILSVYTSGSQPA